MPKEVVLTGLRSNAEFHLGNYLGGILPMVDLQKQHAGQYQLNMFIPDLHSFTTPIEHGKLYRQTIDNLKMFVAAGLDINEPNTFIYRQSYIPAHSELTWILDCFTGFGEMSRMTEFKEKSGALKLDRKQNEVSGKMMSYLSIESPPGSRTLSGEETDTLLSNKEFIKLFFEWVGLQQRKGDVDKSVTVGLFNYPVLMAADILLYGAKYIPVGEDQRQHVEFTRDLAIRMNNKFGSLFVVPEDNQKQMEFAGRSNPVRIRSLRNPEKKMSKSVEDPAGTIMLSDKPDGAAKKVMSATTDSLNQINFDFDKQPGVSNLLQILNLLSNSKQEETNARYQEKTSYGELKADVAEAVKKFLVDFQAKLAKVDENTLMKKLEADEAAMRNVAEGTLLKVQKAVGLRPN